CYRRSECETWGNLAFPWCNQNELTAYQKRYKSAAVAINNVSMVFCLKVNQHSMLRHAPEEMKRLRREFGFHPGRHQQNPMKPEKAMSANRKLMNRFRPSF